MPKRPREDHDEDDQTTPAEHAAVSPTADTSALSNNDGPTNTPPVLAEASGIAVDNPATTTAAESSSSPASTTANKPSVSNANGTTGAARPTSKTVAPPAKRPRVATKVDEEALELAQIEYVVDEDAGLRRVTPYYYLYKTHAKQRWLGMELLAVFDKEFQDRQPGYYKKAIDSGAIQVNHQSVPTTYLLKNNDLITHRNHRHEPPVTSAPITILARTPHFVVVNKPASIPVHPSGRYRHNSVLHIVRRALGTSSTDLVGPPLYALHRLDRLTSGVLILCSDRARIGKLSKQFAAQVVGKSYLCVVAGEFPAGTTTVDAPIMVVSHKLGLNSVHPDGKPSTTHFDLLATDGTRSLVRARPVTGRTHQIRVHLRHLGFPIANDPLYNNPNHRHVKAEREKAAAAAVAESNSGEDATTDSAGAEGTPGATDDETAAWVAAVAAETASRDALTVTGQCTECGTDLYADPPHDHRLIYLHAYEYAVRMSLGELDAPSEYITYDEATKTTTVRTPLPEWATDWPGFDPRVLDVVPSANVDEALQQS
ncbi:RluA family pseudouridine synthase [Allomyces macrogynus ATCC 38327]|uniref:RluA family pseudouridine synthase n=1 Tax=Allomyces macrogynus (strain ATCC 38327) TaxID=578462 RepID=A0A0L0SS95_ALLM3|nr:RluA family pseudouridine synthase [Allomyces macrogynus ATCC 38327]|eukprot:KNE65366.1 RluA family pseudouridine synthase [Allomyces macrogynus ATCC 38327]